MILRPVDESGDILPVLTSASKLTGTDAVKGLVHDRLDLLSGDWWENPAWGNAILEMLKENRYTEADQQVLASYLSSYIRETKGVLEVRDVKCSLEGRGFSFSCVVETETGSAAIHYEF